MSRWYSVISSRLILFTTLVLSHGSTASDLSTVMDATELEYLSSHKTWLKLGHYKASDSSQSSWISEVQSESFFLSSNGRTDPLAELRATLAEFAAPVGENANEHAQCMFKGRYIWLSTQMKLADDVFPKVVCDDYVSWTGGEVITSISLLYATGYLGNPASYYGHTLLKFNSANNTRSPLLDVSLNYGAIVPDGEGPIPYIFKGVTGGYDAGFTHIQYYFHNHNYGELELRDIWEYELDLSPDQVDLIMGHLWELLGKKYIYFFLRENCGYRMAEVLELIEGIEIVPKERSWIFPQAVITNLSKSLINGRSIVSSVKYHPSRQSRMYHRHNQLSSNEKGVVANIVKDFELLESQLYHQSSVYSKQAVLGVLHDYYQFIGKSDDDDSAKKAERIIAERFKLPPGQVFTPAQGLNPPHLGRNPSFLQIGSITNNKLGEGISVRIRPSYYDALDAGSGHVVNSELKMLDAEFVYLDKRLNLRQLDIISVEAVNGAQTGLPGDNGGSWRLKMGIEQQNLSCKSCLVARLQADKGFAKNIGNTLLGVQFGGALQNNRYGYGAAYLKSSIFGNTKLSNKTNFKFEIEHRSHLDSVQKNEMSFSLEGRHSLAKNFDVRFLYTDDKAREFSLSLGYYW